MYKNTYLVIPLAVVSGTLSPSLELFLSFLSRRPLPFAIAADVLIATATVLSC